MTHRPWRFISESCRRHRYTKRRSHIGSCTVAGVILQFLAHGPCPFQLNPFHWVLAAFLDPLE